MIVIDKRKRERYSVPFGELVIGSVFEDGEGVLYIKTSHADPSEQTNCISYEGDQWWDEDKLNTACLVYPITCELILQKDLEVKK